MRLDLEWTATDRVLAEQFSADVYVIGGPVRDKLRNLFHGAPYDPKDLVLAGHDVMQALVAGGRRRKGFSGGRQVGEILRALRDRVIENPELNTPERLHREMEQMITRVA